MALLRIIQFIISHPLCRNHKIRSIVRFIRFQIGSRFFPGSIVFDWLGNSKFIVKHGETGLTGNVYTGLHEFPEMGFVLHFTRKEDLFIDVGSNVGSYSILVGANIGCRGYAFEPVPQTHKKLVQNLRLNELENLIKHPNIAIGEQTGHIKFTAGFNSGNHVVSANEQVAETIEIEVVPLDSVLLDEEPTIMKIDVEGYETAVLLGAKETLGKKSLRCVIMELNGSGQRYGYEESKILEVMRDYGFSTCRYDPLTRDLTEIDGKNLNRDNTLFIRDKDFVLSRVNNCALIEVNGVKF